MSMNVQSYNALRDGIESFQRGLAAYRAKKEREADKAESSQQRQEDIKRQIEREAAGRAVQEKLEQGRMARAKMEIEARMAGRDRIEADARAAREAADSPGGLRGDLLGAEVEAARARAAQLKQQTINAQPSTLDHDLSQTDEWSRQMFRAQQALQQAQAAGDAEAVFVAQGRLGRLQRLGDKYGSEKPQQRMVKIRVPIPGGPDGKEGFREWEEPYDPKVHTLQAMPAGSGTGAPGTVPLTSIEAMKQRFGGGAK
jgi:hypothetical protein